MPIVELLLGEIVAVGFDVEEANQILLVIASFVISHVLAQTGSSLELRRDPQDLAGLRSKKFWPITCKVFSRKSNRYAEFELGLGFIVDGVERKLLHAVP